MSKKLHTLLLSAVLMLITKNTCAQINYTESFDAAHGWTLLSLDNSTEFPCEGTGSLTANLYYYEMEGDGLYDVEAQSPSLGISDGTPLMVSYDYKLINYPLEDQIPTDSNNWGKINLYYSYSPTGPFTLFDTLQSDEHTPSTDCTTVTATFTPQAGLQVYIQINALHSLSEDDYHIHIDNFKAIQGTNSTGKFATGDFRYSPNPVTNVLNLSADSTINDIQVYTILGQLILAKKADSRDAVIDMSVLTAGTYLVKVNSENGAKAVKVVKQ